MQLKKAKITGCRLLNGLQILILEDELNRLTSLTYLLESEGAAVIRLSSVVEMVELSQLESVDIMLLSLETINRYALTKQIKLEDVKIPKETPKIAITESNCNPDWASIRDLGCYTHCFKTFDSSEMIYSILSNINQHRFFQQLQSITNISFSVGNFG